MARKYKSYVQRIAMAKKKEERDRLMKEAEALYGRSYIEEFNDLMAKWQRRKEKEDAERT